MSKGLLDILVDSVFDEKWVGKRGEKLTERELHLVSLLGRTGRTLRNVYVPKNNGETAEIDLLFISQKGIFVLESKNCSGWIFGSEQNQYWTATLPNGQKNRFYNPIRQNRTHITWLRRYIGDDVPLFSIIVFSERCELKKLELTSADAKVIKRDKTYSTVRTIWEANPDKLSNGDIDRIYEALKPLTNVSEAVKAAHVRDIRQRLSAPPAETPPSAQKDAERICPRCGKPLVLRTARKGPNAGKPFYGCSGYPACRYTLELQPD